MSEENPRVYQYREKAVSFLKVSLSSLYIAESLPRPDCIYFFWETTVPKEYLWLRKLVEAAMEEANMGYEVDELHDEQIDEYTHKIIEAPEFRGRTT